MTEVPKRDMLFDLRRRICLYTAAEPLVLHEGEIARQFGVSRTPVREVLTLLAAQKMVKTRPGVGTIPTSLLPERRDADIVAFAAIYRAAATCVQGQPVDREALVGMVACKARLDLVEVPDHGAYVEIIGAAIEALALLVADLILREAVRASHWRLLRWRARDTASDPASVWPRMVANFEEVLTTLRSGTASEVLRRTAERGERYLSTAVAQD